MTHPGTYEEITPGELRDRLGKEDGIFLIDVTLGEHFRRLHLPHATNACVFQVIFMDQIRAVTDDKDTEIVLYGSSVRSMDAATAAEKLLREGYRKVYVLRGGIEAWRSEGFPLEGEAVDDPGDPQTVLTLADRSYVVDTDRSLIEWKGRNSGTTHFGTVKIASGELMVKAGNMTGRFAIDMDSITNLNLEGDALQPILVAHLKSDDFFFTSLFPTATLEIISARPVGEPLLSRPNLDVKGVLELKGVKAPLDFLATVGETPDKALVAEAHFDIDRTKWGILYGSARFFEYLGMHMVFDVISFQVRIVAS